MAEAGDYLEPEINFPIDFDLVDDMMDPHPPPLTPKQLKHLRRRLHLPKAGPMAKEESGGTVEVKREYLEVLVYPWLAEEEGRFIEARDHVRVLLESGRHE